MNDTKSKKSQECTSSLDRFSSKIKSLTIPLYGYQYYHTPSKIENPDERYIGRENIIHRLKSLLTNNKTKNGAYLVTGYRGVGKTSLVNEVLRDITGPKNSNENPQSKKNIPFLRYVVGGYPINCVKNKNCIL